MIPFITIATDIEQSVLEDLVPAYSLEYRCEKRDGSSVFTYDLANDEEIPESFAQGMKEIEEGLAIDFDKALNEPPPAE